MIFIMELTHLGTEVFITYTELNIKNIKTVFNLRQSLKIYFCYILVLKELVWLKIIIILE